MKPKKRLDTKVPEGMVQATSILEVAQVPVTDSVDFRANVPVIAVQHNAVRFADMWKDALENNGAKINNIIKKRAALYYSVLAPTTLSDIRDKLGTVVKQSLRVFSTINGVWKYQNALQFEDEDGYNLAGITNCITRKTLNVRTTAVQEADIACKYAINNTLWKRDILKKLKQIYISDMAGEFIHTICGHFVQINDDDTHEKLCTWDNADVFLGRDAIFKNYDSLVDYLDDCVEDIDSAYNSYPFMDEVLADLGLKQPGETYNFTRDLSQTKLKVLSDVDRAIEDMIFMTNVYPNVLDTIDESATALYSIVRASNADGSYFSYYKDDTASADCLNYADRTHIAINSITNALRGNAFPANIAFMTVDKGDNTRDERVMNPFPLKPWSAAVSTDADFWYFLNEVNQLNEELDMPGDSTAMKINSISQIGSGDTLDFEIINFQMQLFISSGDYLLSAGDVESVISDATFFFLFGDLKKLDADAQTLSNNGKN